MINPFVSNATIKVWDRPPNQVGAVAIATGVRIRQLKPWGTVSPGQEGVSNMGWLYRWIIFAPDFVPVTQRSNNVAPKIFYATIIGAPADHFYQGKWSQVVMNGADALYTYMALANMPWI